MHIPGVDRGSGVVFGATQGFGVAIECCIGIPDVDGRSVLSRDFVLSVNDVGKYHL